VESKSIKPKKTSKKKLKEAKETEIEDVEAFVFEKLTKKNAIWNGSETKGFQNWKAKTKNKYRIETGKISHYKGKPTRKYSLNLKSLLKKVDFKKEKPKKPVNKKSIKLKKVEKEFTEQYFFEKITGKNAIWNGSETKGFQNWKAKTSNKYRKDTGRISHYRGKATKKFSLYLNSLLKKEDNKNQKPKKSIDKKPIKQKKEEKEFSEQFVFESVTGKNAIWSGSETQNFLKWKHRTHKKYKKDTGKYPYYKQNLTKNFKNYLKKTFNIS
jgi:hypothetical protein